jgi:hypothetical protein
VKRQKTAAGWYASGGGARPGPKRKFPDDEFDDADDAAARPARKAKIAAELTAAAVKQLAQQGRRGNAAAALSEGEVKDAVLQMGFEAKAIEAALARKHSRKQKITSVSDMVELIVKMSGPPRKSKAPVKKAKSISGGSSAKTSSVQAPAGVEEDLASIQKRVRAHVSQILRERSYIDAYERPSWGEQHGYSGSTDANVARKHSTTPVTELARAADRIQVILGALHSALGPGVLIRKSELFRREQLMRVLCHSVPRNRFNRYSKS